MARAAGADITEADNKCDALIPKLMKAAKTPPVYEIIWIKEQLLYNKVKAPAIVANPPVMTAWSSDLVIFERKGLISKGASVWIYQIGLKCDYVTYSTVCNDLAEENISSGIHRFGSRCTDGNLQKPSDLAHKKLHHSVVVQDAHTKTEEKYDGKNLFRISNKSKRN